MLALRLLTLSEQIDIHRCGPLGGGAAPGGLGHRQRPRPGRPTPRSPGLQEGEGGMTPSDFHVIPNFEAVAALVDSHGRHAAVERWGWLDAETVWRLTAKGRRRSGRGRPVGGISGAGAHLPLTPAWDGAKISAHRLTPATAAAALRISAATVSGGW